MNEITKPNSENSIDGYVVTNDIVTDAKAIVNASQASAYQAINVALVKRNWLIGMRIATEEFKERSREDVYGKEIVDRLSKELTREYGKGFSRSNLYQYVKFYTMFPDFVHAVSGQSFHPLSWTHYRSLLRVEEESAREWYMNEAANEGWSSRTLDRNIQTQYYYRLLKSQIDKKPAVKREMEALTEPLQRDKHEFIKNPVVAEFLGLAPNSDFQETQLEGAIISNLQKFLLELGKGYAFVARQQHIRTELNDFFIDLVFYNYHLKCFVLIDLKTTQLTHQDIGQMDMYVKMYDELKKADDDNPTLGIVLCTETDKDVAHYSILNDNEQLFAAKYMTYLPTQDQLKEEIERQVEFFKEKQEAEGLEDD